MLLAASQLWEFTKKMFEVTDEKIHILKVKERVNHLLTLLNKQKATRNSPNKEPPSKPTDQERKKSDSLFGWLFVYT